MGHRMTITGVGPRLLAVTVAFLTLMVGAHYLFYPLFKMGFLPRHLRLAIGGALLSAGLAIWAAGIVAVVRAFRSGRLITTGMFRFVRNPIYAAEIGLVMPGIAFLWGSWLLFAVPVFMYGAFRVLLKSEERMLEDRFGQEYLDYRRRVNAVLPMHRRVNQ